jgi:hypothetical protein
MNYPFFGTITQVITATSDPRLQVGQTLVGVYAYESPVTNGRFCRGGQWGENQTLQGFVLCYYPGTASFSTPIFNCSNGGFIVVANGAVTDFHCDDEAGNLGMTFSFSKFTFSGNQANDPAQPAQYQTSGTVSFCAPVQVSY